MTDRLPPIPTDALTADQRRAVDEIVAGQRGSLYGPFIPMLRSPELVSRAQRLGEYLRYRATVPERLRELTILMVARHWDQAYEWWVHEPIAQQAGISIEAIAALACGARPQFMTDAETAVYEFCTELHGTKTVRDETFERTKGLLGEAGLVDLVGLCGYYAMLAMLMNVARTPLPAQAVPFALSSGRSA
jgi:4-carboxymuconolactone decarboxylase